jgi:MFS superfamily sulfate permease-like transporter
VAGVTLGGVMVPVGMAFGDLAGVHPVAIAVVREMLREPDASS